jgi:AcrR family transcriptional regulator
MSRAEQKQQTRQRILQVARERFLAHGYDATTLQGVADQAGVAVGTVVAHFPDKPSLVAAAFHADLDAAVARAWQRANEHEDLIERLMALATELYTFYATDRALYRRMFQESLFLAREGALNQQLGEFLGRVAADVALLRPDLPAELVAHGFFADYLYVLVGGLAGALPSVEAQCVHLRALLSLRIRSTT